MSGPDELDPRTTPARDDLADKRLMGLVRAERFVDCVQMRAASGAVAIFQSPSEDAQRTATLLAGEPVRVYEVASEWAWLQSAVDDYVGYVKSYELSMGWLDEARARRIRVLRAHLYADADLKSPVLGWVPLGGRVAAATDDPAVAGFKPVDGGGWIYEAHLADQVPEDWVAVAEMFIGAPYLWGGESVEGVDCSGLVQVALESSGMAAPRDSDMQEAALGLQIDTDAPLRRGDLVFWRGHVGVMRDAHALVHANAHHMAVAAEPLADARARIDAAGGGEPTSIRRI